MSEGTRRDTVDCLGRNTNDASTTHILGQYSIYIDANVHYTDTGMSVACRSTCVCATLTLHSNRASRLEGGDRDLQVEVAPSTAATSDL